MSSKQLQVILSEETEKLRKSYDSDELSYPLVGIVRSLDYNHFILSHQNGLKEKHLLDKYLYGWSLAFSEFYKDYSPTDYIPLYSSEETDSDWIDSLLQFAGSIQLCQQLLAYEKAGLMKLKRRNNGFIFTSKIEGPGLEFYEKKSLDYYFNLNDKILKEKSKPLIDKFQSIQKKLEKVVSIFQNQFIQYRATEEIDKFYSKFAYIYLMTTQVIDDFDETETFGGITYGTYLDFAEEVIKAGMMHRDFCMAATKKTNGQVKLRDVLTYAFNTDRFLESYNEYSGQPKEMIEQLLNAFTINKDNMSHHLAYPKVCAAPYFKFGPNTLARSSYGSISMPVFFLNRELKRKYPNDYFKAVNNREGRFRNQLYDIMKYKNVISIEDNIILRTEKVVTDIDGVLFDTSTKSLGLFQLKWQDTFSSSMTERFSRITNLIPKSVEWIDKISHWISQSTEESMINTLKLPEDTNEINDVFLFVLSRNHVHFSNEELDNRAIWASWYQLVEAVTSVKSSNTDPIAELAAKLNSFDPKTRSLREGEPHIFDLKFRFSDYEVAIMSNNAPWS